MPTHTKKASWQDNPITVIKETFMPAYVLSGCVDAGDSSVQTASLEHDCVAHLEPPSAADLTTPNVKGKTAGEFNTKAVFPLLHVYNRCCCLPDVSYGLWRICFQRMFTGRHLSHTLPSLPICPAPSTLLAC